MTCALVPSGKTVVLVPLWSQYIVDCKEPGMELCKWIVVSNYERWVMQLVNLITRKSVRQVAKSFTDCFRKEFIACMEVARAVPGGLEDPFEEGGSLDDHVSVAKRVKSTTSVMEVDIGGYKVKCLNTTARMLLLLEKETVTFITSWIVPLVRELALKHEQTGSEGVSETDSSESVGALAGFHFIASPTPNIRDKVNWNPSTHSWAIQLRQPIAKPSGNFAVDPSLSADLYEEQKIDAYVLACHCNVEQAGR